MPTKTDGAGNITEVAPNMITVQYSRKMGRENYGNEEFGIFAQLPVEPDTDDVEIEARIKGLSTFVKTIVHDQLGIDSTLTDAGVVRDLAQAAPTKAAPAKRPTTPAAGKPDTTALWQSWVDDPSRWWDNRVGKRNPKAPDFKHKDSGDGLWLDKAPAFAKLVLEGAAS